MESASQITNRWGEVELVPVKVEEHVVFEGHEGAAYSHHAQITSKGERLIATWSNGVAHEDDVGQCMMMATSDDGGETWSEPAAVVPRQPGEHAEAVITNGGIRVVGDMLVAYYGSFEFTAEGLVDGHRQPLGMAKAPHDVRWHQNVKCAARISEDGGFTWTDAGVMVDRFVPNLGPSVASTGRLIMPGNLLFPYTDDPSGLSGWRVAGIPRLPADYVDDSEGHHKGGRARGDQNGGYCEGSFFETDDGVLHMMLRSRVFRFAVSESRDNGETWSEPVLTRWIDGRNKPCFGRLPDGRYYGLCTPERGRTPLILATSEDGVVFDRHYLLGDAPRRAPRMEGLNKGGRYGYPHLHVMGDMVYVIFSVTKEDIVVGRFKLSALR